jgi:hypothetical protein
MQKRKVIVYFRYIHKSSETPVLKSTLKRYWFTKKIFFLKFLTLNVRKDRKRQLEKFGSFIKFFKYIIFQCTSGGGTGDS